MSELEENILNELKKYNGHVGIYIDDMNGNIVKLNEDETFETASCIKLYILLEYYRQIYNGTKRREDKILYEEKYYSKGAGILKSMSYGLELSSKDLAFLMIVYSDNVATNMLMDYLELKNLNEIKKLFNLKKTELLGDFYLEKNKPVGVSTVGEYAEIYRRIYNKEVFNEEISSEILEILKKQHYKDILTKKFKFKYKRRDSDVIKYIASKSGKYNGILLNDGVYNVLNDGGIISTIYGDYIIIIFINEVSKTGKFENDKAINTAAKISNLVLEFFIKNNGSLREEKKV